MRKKQYGTGLIAILCLLLLILDSKTVLVGAREAIELILYAVIPSLFPFLLTTSVLNSIMTGKRVPGLQKIGKWCGIPAGAEFIFLLGVTGGYPIGAKTIYEEYESGQLDCKIARRMLGFCNNAGPAFIFGMLGPIFTQVYTPFLLWGIHVLSALLVGIILPGKSRTLHYMPRTIPSESSRILEKNIRAMAIICAWIFIWRIIIAMSSKYFLLKLPAYLQVIFIGLCELTNGCLALNSIGSESIRFILASCFLSFGGICVALQTKSVTGKLGTGMYLPGKCLQVLVSLILSILFSYLLYPSAVPHKIPLLIPIALLLICVIILILRQKRKKGSFSMQHVI